MPGQREEMSDREMMKALIADGEKLRQLTGEDHGPWDWPPLETEDTGAKREAQVERVARAICGTRYKRVAGQPITFDELSRFEQEFLREDARAALAAAPPQDVERRLKECADELFDLRNRCGCGPEQSGPDVFQRLADVERATIEHCAQHLEERAMGLRRHDLHAAADVCVVHAAAIRALRPGEPAAQGEEKCRSCLGTGEARVYRRAKRIGKVPCPACNGTGRIAAPSEKEKCPRCAGHGRIFSGNTCLTCGGTGRAPAPEKEPVAWVFELALAGWAPGEYTNWSAPRLSFTKPCVPEGSIRNLRPLYYGDEDAST